MTVPPGELSERVVPGVDDSVVGRDVGAGVGEGLSGGLLVEPDGVRVSRLGVEFAVAEASARATASWLSGVVAVLVIPAASRETAIKPTVVAATTDINQLSTGSQRRLTTVIVPGIGLRPG